MGCRHALASAEPYSFSRAATNSFLTLAVLSKSSKPFLSVARFGAAGAGLFDRPLAAHNDQRSGKGELGLEGLNGEGVQSPGFDAPVAGLGLGKKGVSFNASNP